MSDDLVWPVAVLAFIVAFAIATWIFGSDDPSDVARQLNDAAERLAGPDPIIAREQLVEWGAGEWDPDFDILHAVTARGWIRCSRRRAIFKSNAPVETTATPWENARM